MLQGKGEERDSVLAPTFDGDDLWPGPYTTEP